MRAAIRVTFLLNIVTCIASAQTTSMHKPEPDRLGMTCADILKMSSTEWVGYFGERTQVSAVDKGAGVTRAAGAYGKCYDARTDALVAALAKDRRGPSKAARADFASFEVALKEFSAKALAEAQPAADSRKRALAALYEEQFRYDFYQGYQPKILPPSNPVKSISSMAAADENKEPAHAVARTPANSSTQRTPIETDEMSKAKNRFGELLGALPEERLHELHASFGGILGLHEVDRATTLAVYRYAIFLLEPTSGPTSYPPPF